MTEAHSHWVAVIHSNAAAVWLSTSIISRFAGVPHGASHIMWSSLIPVQISILVVVPCYSPKCTTCNLNWRKEKGLSVHDVRPYDDEELSADWLRLHLLGKTTSWSWITCHTLCLNSIQGLHPLAHIRRDKGCPNSKTPSNAAHKCSLHFSDLKAAPDGSFLA